jgi:hypothetical protein
MRVAVVALALFVAVALFAALDAYAADKYLCSITSTATVSRNMRDAGGDSPACPTPAGGARMSVQCDVPACVATGSGDGLQAACVYDGGTAVVGRRYQANAIHDVILERSANNVATLCVAGTCKCDLSAVTP